MAVAALLLFLLWAPWDGPPAASRAPGAAAGSASGEVGSPEAAPPLVDSPEPEGGVVRREAATVEGDEAEVGTAAESDRGSVVGRLLVEADKVDRYVWKVRLTGPGRRPVFDRVELGEDGSFRVEGLKPARYTAVAELHGMTVSVVDGLEVAAGGALHDARLNPWRPEEGMRSMRLHIAGEPGQRGDTSVWAVAAGDRLRGHANWVRDEWILYTTPTASPDALIYAPGHRPQRLPWRDGPVEVELEPGIEVRLRAAAPVSLAEGIRRGWFEIRPEDPPFGMSALRFGTQFPAADLAAGKTVTVRLPLAGGYMLAFAGARQDGPGFLPLFDDIVQRGLHVEDAPAQELTVVLTDPLGAQR